MICMARRDSFIYKFKNNQPLLKSITWAQFLFIYETAKTK